MYQVENRNQNKTKTKTNTKTKNKNTNRKRTKRKDQIKQNRLLRGGGGEGLVGDGAQGPP